MSFKGCTKQALGERYSVPFDSELTPFICAQEKRTFAYFLVFGLINAHIYIKCNVFLALLQ